MAALDAPRIPIDMARQIVTPAAYGEWHGLQRIFAALRRESPIALAEVEGMTG